MGPPPADPSLIADAVHSGDRASVPPGFGSYRTARRRAQRTRALLRLRDFCTARCRTDHQEEGNTPSLRMYEYEEPERQVLHHDEPQRGGTLAPPPGLERGGEDATGAPTPPPHTGPTPQQKASMDKFRAMFEVGAFRPETLWIQELEEAGCPPQHIKELFPEMEKAGCSPEGGSYDKNSVTSQDGGFGEASTPEIGASLTGKHRHGTPGPPIATNLGDRSGSATASPDVAPSPREGEQTARPPAQGAPQMSPTWRNKS